MLASNTLRRSNRITAMYLKKLALNDNKVVVYIVPTNYYNKVKYIKDKDNSEIILRQSARISSQEKKNNNKEKIIH